MSKTICFYIGYTHDFNDNNVLYGSELALRKLAEQFVKHGNSVHVFGPCLHKEVNIAGVTYSNSDKLESFGKEHSIDVMILSRYMVYFLDFKIRSKKNIYMATRCIYYAVVEWQCSTTMGEIFN